MFLPPLTGRLMGWLPYRSAIAAGGGSLLAAGLVGASAPGHSVPHSRSR